MVEAAHDELPYGTLPAVDAPGMGAALRTPTVVGLVLAGAALVALFVFAVVARSADLDLQGHRTAAGAYRAEAEVLHRNAGATWLDRYLLVRYHDREGRSMVGRVHYEADTPVPDDVGGQMEVWVDPNVDGWVTWEGPPARWKVPVLWVTGAILLIAGLRGTWLLRRTVRLRRTIGHEPWRTVDAKVRVAWFGRSRRTLVWVDEAAGPRVVALDLRWVKPLEEAGPRAVQRVEVAGRSGRRLAIRTGPWEPVFVGRPPRSRHGVRAFASVFDDADPLGPVGRSPSGGRRIHVSP